jgi:hypothetical protein
MISAAKAHQRKAEQMVRELIKLQYAGALDLLEWCEVAQVDEVNLGRARDGVSAARGLFDTVVQVWEEDRALVSDE